MHFFIWLRLITGHMAELAGNPLILHDALYLHRIYIGMGSPLGFSLSLLQRYISSWFYLDLERLTFNEMWVFQTGEKQS